MEKNMLAYGLGVAHDFALALTDEQKEFIKTCTTPEQCNKYLLDLVANRQKPADIPSDILQKIDEIPLKKNYEAVRERELSIKRYIKDADEYAARSQDCLIKATRVREELSLMLMQKEHSITDMVKELHAEGWFKLVNVHHVDGTAVLTFTTPNVVLTDDRPTVNLSVAMGVYSVVWNPHKAMIRVLPSSGNVEYSGYFHPHISTENKVCWGNAAPLVNDILAHGGAKDIKPMFNALRVILTTYNSESPYAIFNGFYNKQAGKTEATTPRLNIICGGYEYEYFGTTMFRTDEVNYFTDYDDVYEADLIEHDYIEPEEEDEDGYIPEPYTELTVHAFKKVGDNNSSLYTRDQDGVMRCIS